MFTASHIENLKTGYAGINRIDPCGDTYPKLIKLLDELSQDMLRQLASADIKFVSKLAANRVKDNYLNDSDYQPGCILECSWGYDQTNIEYFVIAKRSGNWVTLQKIGSKNIQSKPGSMVGTCEPDTDNIIAGIRLRRQLCVRDGSIIGCNYEKGYGWIRAWDGKPSSWTAYA